LASSTSTVGTEQHPAGEADERDADVVLNDECRRERGILHAVADLAAGHLIKK
jgi:hypothetical protein